MRKMLAEHEDFLEIYTKIEVDMVTIKEFCERNGIKREKHEKHKDYSDLYVGIYRKYESNLDIWYTIGADGEEEKHAMLYYKPSDLKEYFVSNDLEVEVVQDRETKLYHMAYYRKNFAPSGFERRILVASTKKGYEDEKEVEKLVKETRAAMEKEEDANED